MKNRYPVRVIMVIMNETSDRIYRGLIKQKILRKTSQDYARGKVMYWKTPIPNHIKYKER